MYSPCGFIDVGTFIIIGYSTEVTGGFLEVVGLGVGAVDLGFGGGVGAVDLGFGGAGGADMYDWSFMTGGDEYLDSSPAESNFFVSDDKRLYSQ